MNKLSIRLERCGDHGWEFSVTDDDGTSRFRTNPQGDGLWEYRAQPGASWMDGSPVMEYQQITGTCQFWLPPERKRAYDKIRYEWSRR